MNSLHVINYISLAYKSLGDAVNETAYFNQLAAYPQYQNSAVNRHDIHRTRALFFLHEGSLELAEIELNITLNTAVQLAHVEWIAMANCDFGLLYEKLGNYEEALAHYHKALNIELQLERYLHASIILQNIGALLLQLEKTSEAASYFQHSMEKLITYQQQSQHPTKIEAIEYKAQQTHAKHQLLATKLPNWQTEKQPNRLKYWLSGLGFFLMTILTISALTIVKRKEKLMLAESINQQKQQSLMLDTNNQAANKNHDPDNKKRLQKALVKTMVDAVNIWFRYTGKNKIDLAYQSKSWKVSNDNGNLRTRSMDKYLNINQIPQNPRWRNVLRTCHFILSNDDLDNNDRRLLEHNIKTIMRLIKAQ